MTKPNIVLLADCTDVLFMQKSLGAHKIAYELRMSGYDVFVLNHLHVFSIEEIKNILRKLINENTVYVGTSPAFYQSIESAETYSDEHEFNAGGTKFTAKELGAYLPHGRKYNTEIRQLISELSPNCKMVLGGPDAVDTENSKHYDYLISGYGETSAVDLANHLSKQTPLVTRRSLFGPKILANLTSEGYDFTCSGMGYEDHDFVLPNETLTLEVGRGCIFKCAFCSAPVTGKKKYDYVKDFSILRKEIMDNYERFGVTRYLMCDDTFNDSVEKMEMIYELSKSLPFKLEYWAYIRLDLLIAHPHTVKLLFESGCRGVYFGIESFNEETGRAIGKSGKRDKLIAAIHDIKSKYGDQLMLHGSFIFGLPYESVDSLKITGELLATGQTGLDSFAAKPLRLSESNFMADLDLNYEKYGYRILEVNNVTNHKIWENDHLNWYQAGELCDYYFHKSVENGQRRIPGLESFFIAGLDIELEFSQNRPMNDFDWHFVENTKKQRAELYKTKVLNYLGLQNSKVV